MDELKPGVHVTPNVRLTRPLAEGGMGKVWVAEHLVLRTEVVVKFMHKSVAGNADAAARFTSEAAAIAAVKGPHVVTIFDSGVTESGTPYHVMELLDGRDLDAHIAANGPMAPADVAVVLSHLAKALGKAHRVGIIHRDVKPENIFLCNTEGEIFVKLLDFGTAKQDVLTAPTTTTTGQLLGTPYYMSPEQIVGDKDIDARTDIWSLGVVAFEALTGKRPFEGATVGALTLAIHSACPKVTSVAPHLPAGLDLWFAKACARAPRDRFRTVRELADAFALAINATSPHLLLEVDHETDPSRGDRDVVSTGAPPAASSSPSVSRERPARTVSALSATLAPRRTPRRGIWIAALAATATLVLVFASFARRSEEEARKTEPTAESALHAARANVVAQGEPKPAETAPPHKEAPSAEPSARLTLSAAPRPHEAPPLPPPGAGTSRPRPSARPNEDLPVFVEPRASAAPPPPSASAPPPPAPDPPPSASAPAPPAAPLEVLPPAAPRENLSP